MLGQNLIKYNLDKCKFLVFDFETENLSLTNAKCWELGWSIYHGSKKIEEHQHYLKWPNLNVSKEAAKITNFNPKNVMEKGKNPKEVIDLFDKYLYNKEYRIIGANLLGYDVYIHNTARNELGYSTDYSYVDRIYDTVALSRAYKLNISVPENQEDFLSYQYRLLNIRQKGLKTSNSAMAKEFGMEINESLLHQSSYDNELCFHVFLNLVTKLQIQ